MGRLFLPPVHVLLLPWPFTAPQSLRGSVSSAFASSVVPLIGLDPGPWQGWGTDARPVSLLPPFICFFKVGGGVFLKPTYQMHINTSNQTGRIKGLLSPQDSEHFGLSQAPHGIQCTHCPLSAVKKPPNRHLPERWRPGQGQVP